MMDQFKPHLPFPKAVEKFDLRGDAPKVETPRAWKLFKRFVAAAVLGAMVVGSAELVKQEDTPASPPPISTP